MIKGTYSRAFVLGLRFPRVRGYDGGAEVPDGRRQKQQLRAHIPNHKQKVETTVGVA